MRALPQKEAADLMRVSERTVRRRAISTVADLPPDAQVEWAARAQHKVVNIGEAAPGQLALSLTVPVGPNLSEEDREQAMARYRIIEPVLKPDEFPGLWGQCGNRKLQVVELLARENGTKTRTVYHWLQQWKNRGIEGLVNKDRADKGRPRALTTAALDFLQKAAIPRQGGYGLYTVAEIYRAYNEERVWRATHASKALGDFERGKYAKYLGEDGRLRPDAQLPEASYETFRTWYKRIPEVLRVMGREGLEAFANTQEIISYRALSEIEPLDYVVMDHRRLDLFCLVPGKGQWRLVRPWLTAAIDMRTRRWLGWVIVETPSSDSIAACLKRVFIDHGLPKSVYWDNGKDFTCEWLEGRHTRSERGGRIAQLNDGWRGVMDTLGVRVHHAIVRRARAKIIEPNFRATAEFDKSTEWWCGHRPDARPERFEALVEKHEAFLRGDAPGTPFVTIEAIAQIYDAQMRVLNERPLTGGEGMRKVLPTGRMGWMSPGECWDTLIRRIERRTVAPEVLQFAFAKRRELTVRHGEIATTFGGRKFHYRPMGDPIGLMPLNGHAVEIGYDPLDLGTVAVYYGNRFLGLAQNAELRRMGEQHFVQDERDRRLVRREVRRAIGQLHREPSVPGVIERLNRRLPAPRPEVEREEIAAQVPAAIAAAARAAEEEKSFSFAADVTDVVRVADAAYRDDDPDDEFDFFGGTK